jgi:hypothetical protein
MFELQKPKLTMGRPTPELIKIEEKPIPIPIESFIKKESVPTSLPSRYPDPPAPRPDQALDWGDDDSMSFDAVSKLMTESAPSKALPVSPVRTPKSLIQFDTEELKFVTDEQLLKSSRTFHTSPSKATEQEETIAADQKDEHLRLFWLDAYEDPVAQPGTQTLLSTTVTSFLSFAGKLFLFGKTPLLSDEKSTSKTYVSVCVIVDNIPKQVFILPKAGVSER